MVAMYMILLLISTFASWRRAGAETVTIEDAAPATLHASPAIRHPDLTNGTRGSFSRQVSRTQP